MQLTQSHKRKSTPSTLRPLSLDECRQVAGGEGSRSSNDDYFTFYTGGSYESPKAMKKLKSSLFM